LARNLYFLGTAGCGKSTMVRAFHEWMVTQGLDTVTVNLDPGADRVPYEVDIDVRDWIRLSEVMEEHGLGPNGAQVLAADLLAMKAGEVAEVMETFRTGYFLIDTPGQMELFTFRESSRVVIDAFGREDSALVYLNDPALVKTASGMISSVLLSATALFRHVLPFVNVLSKSDLLSPEELETIVKWSLDPLELYDALMQDAATPKTLLDVEFFKSMETIGVYRKLFPVSSEASSGFEDVYNQVQLTFEGGDDLRPD
jgi:GTPase SAR1 family protein